MKHRILYLLLFSLVVFASCGEYNKILKSTDNELKYSYAKKYFEEGKYGRAITLLQDIVPYLKGTSNGEDALYLLAQSFFYDKDYETANQYYTAYINQYPRGQYVQTARFNSAYGLYLDSPDVRLDQTNTYRAIQGFQDFIELYPQSEKVEIATQSMFDLQEKLAQKDLMAARLYYNLGNYMGNNYEACVVTSREGLKSYPYSKQLEEFQALIVRSRYQLATQSIEEKKPVRFRDVIDEYYNYQNMFPEGRYKKEFDRYYRRASKELGLAVEGVDTSDDVIEETK